jgi:hypothetical protein
MAVLLGALAMRMPATRARHVIVWGSILFFNAVSVIIEGAFFAPALVSAPAVLFLAARSLISSLVAAGLIAWLFAPQPPAPALKTSSRPWYSWTWRFLVSAASYLLFYFIFGAVNYALVTQPYYATHAGGITVPDPMTVLMAELVRAPLIALSVLAFVRWMPGRRWTLAVLTGLLLFVIGGVVSLLNMVGILPIFLIVASGVEIFFQNFLTGVVCALLLRPKVNEPSAAGDSTPSSMPAPVG